MTMDINNLNDLHMDVLKELGNIGAGNAVTALSRMVNKKIDMSVPKSKILDFNEVSELVGGPEIESVGIYFELSGDITGSMLFMLNVPSAMSLVSMLMGVEYTARNLDDIGRSALKEIGNILTGSYLSALSGMTRLKMHITIPALAIDMSGAILSVPAIQFGFMGDKVLLIETEFFEGNKVVKGDFFLLPDVDSFPILLKSLGVTF